MSNTTWIRPIVLIADDDDVTRLMLSEAAAAADLEVIAVADGERAAHAGARFDIAAALLDVQMPGLDGYAVCQALRSLPGRESLPIVMITGHDDAASVERAFEVGATDFIGKPVNWTLLPHRLRYIIRNAGVMRSLERREAENRALIESIPDRVRLLESSGFLVRDLNGQRHSGSQALIARSVVDLVPPGEAARVRAALQETARDGVLRSFEYSVGADDGSQRHYEIRLARCARSEVIMLERDVTLRHWQQERIRQLAYTDALTGLPNRQAFVERIEALLPSLDSSHDQLAVLYIDLDDFRRINETFGHDVGDELLKAFGVLLGEIGSDCDAVGHLIEVARFGADEFIVALRHAQAHQLALAMANRLNARLDEPVRCGSHEFFLAASVGIALLPDHGHDAATLIKNADAAMHFAKDQGVKDPAVYAPVIGQRAKEQLALDAHLRRAMRDEMFELHYQPKFRVDDGRLVGAEALLRWYHPELGQVPPDRFIPLAEQSGLIIDLGAWVVRTACRQLRNWLDRGIVTQLSVNMSGTEFLYGEPARVVAEACKASAIEPACLEIEITESVLVSDSSLVQRRLRNLRELGCRIALDDFGTGYSSLAYLRRFPPDTIKINPVFVDQVHVNQGDAAIYESVRLLARHFGLTLVAEGVENQAQLDWLRERGCDQAQGYLLGRPMPAHRLEQLLVQAAPAAVVDAQRRTGTCE